MAGIVEKFVKLKTSIGGNREKTGYEDTFGMPKEEQAHITRPNKANNRIISELEFALHLSEEAQGRYDGVSRRKFFRRLPIFASYCPVGGGSKPRFPAAFPFVESGKSPV